jgi:hypothetical protein
MELWKFRYFHENDVTSGHFFVGDDIRFISMSYGPYLIYGKDSR